MAKYIGINKGAMILKNLVVENRKRTEYNTYQDFNNINSGIFLIKMRSP